MKTYSSGSSFEDKTPILPGRLKVGRSFYNGMKVGKHAFITDTGKQFSLAGGAPVRIYGNV